MLIWIVCSLGILMLFLFVKTGRPCLLYTSGRGGVRVRARYNYDKASNCLEITEIPPTTTVEVIIDKIVELVKNGKMREIADIRDETDLSGLKIAIDLKRGVDPDKLCLLYTSGRRGRGKSRAGRNCGVFKKSQEIQ